MRLRIDPRLANDHQHSGSKHNRGGIIGKQSSDDGASQVGEQEQSLRRTVCPPPGDIGNPVENAFFASHFGENHHADQKKINVKSFVDSLACLTHGEQASRNQQ